MNLLRYYMMQIEQHTGALSELLREFAIPQHAVMYQLPRITKEEEQHIIDDDYDAIPVTRLTGEDAINYAIAAFKDMYVYDNNMSRRFVQKYPGFVPMACPWSKVEPVLTGLNQAKAQFKAQVQQFDGAEEKFFEVHERFHYLITTMAYRKVYGFTGNYKAFYFNWSRRPRVEADTKANWLEKLGRAKTAIPANHTKSSWYALIDQEIDTVTALDVEKLSIRRPIKLRPECSVRDTDGKMLGYSAGLPFLLTDFHQPPKVSRLKDYSRTPPVTRSGRWQLILPRLHLYQKLE